MNKVLSVIRRERMERVRTRAFILSTFLMPIFLIAVLVFGEPFDGAKRIAFPLIWAALVIYSYTLIKAARSRRRAVHNETSLRPE